MYDIHNHLPCGISDGPDDVSVSEAMLDSAARQGITWINSVCHYAPEREEPLRAIVANLAPLAEKRGIKLHPGFEYDFSHILADEFKPVTIADGSPFYLVDFRHNDIPSYVDRTVFRNSVEGYRMILVHPEQLFSPDKVKELLKLRKAETVFQLNAVSFLPDSGKYINAFAHLLLRAGLGQAIASDAHQPEGIRRVALGEAREVLAKTYGEDAAEMLFDVNPRRLVEGKDPHHVSLPPLTWWERLRYGIRKEK